MSRRDLPVVDRGLGLSIMKLLQWPALRVSELPAAVTHHVSGSDCYIPLLMKGRIVYFLTVLQGLVGRHERDFFSFIIPAVTNTTRPYRVLLMLRSADGTPVL